MDWYVLKCLTRIILPCFLLNTHTKQFYRTLGNQGQSFFQIEGLKLTARRVQGDKNFKKGEKVFEADLSFNSMTNSRADKKLETILKVIPGLKPQAIFHGKGIVASQGQRQQIDGHFVLFERNTCAFIFSSFSMIVLFQRVLRQPEQTDDNGGLPPPLANRRIDSL